MKYFTHTIAFFCGWAIGVAYIVIACYQMVKKHGDSSLGDWTDDYVDDTYNYDVGDLQDAWHFHDVNMQNNTTAPTEWEQAHGPFDDD